jgi:citrate lyase alpha subunit
MQSTDTDPTRKTTIKQSSVVDRTETVVIGGQSVDVFVVETDISFTSAATDLNGTGHLTNWVSPVYKMPVKLHSTLKGTYAAFSFDTDTTSDLVDLRPS